MKAGLAAVLLLLCALPERPAPVQELTIPEALAKDGVSLVHRSDVPSGMAPTLDDILKTTDLIVRGVAAEGRSYLTADQREIYTDYVIRNPRTLYTSHTLAADRPGTVATFTVTLFGGTIQMNGLSYKSEHATLPSLDPGQEYILLLTLTDGRYFVAGRYFGAFRVADGLVEPSTKMGGFATDYRGKSAADASAGLVAKAVHAHQAKH